jgi:hypothetical protein
VLAINCQQRRGEYAISGGVEFFPGTSVSRWCTEWSDLLTDAISSAANTTNNNTATSTTASTTKSGGKKGGKRSAGATGSGKASPMSYNTDTQNLFVTFIKSDSSNAAPSLSVLSSNGKASSGTHQVDGDYALVGPYSSKNTTTSSSSSSSSSESAATTITDTNPTAASLDQLGPDKCSEEYSSNLLDILALAFTAVKLLFLLGQLGPLPRLIGHLEWARRASKKPLHETK